MGSTRTGDRVGNVRNRVFWTKSCNDLKPLVVVGVSKISDTGGGWGNGFKVPPFRENGSEGGPDEEDQSKPVGDEVRKSTKCGVSID